jgi:amidase
VMESIQTTDIGAFCTHDSVFIEGKPHEPLSGLTFALKDIYDVAGHTCCCGNPDWIATHSPAIKTAPVVQRLIDAGATLAGMSITEELVMGLTGENPFYGTPINIAAPGRVTGGSSSGSAAATAAGLVDFALGSDTGGSVRVPASFCGIYGIRPTHGRISLRSVMPFAPSLDTAGWFAREPHLLAQIGNQLLRAEDRKSFTKPQRLLIARDAFAVLDEDAQAILMTAVRDISEHFDVVEDINMAGSDSLADWSKLIAVFREYEGWHSHRDWIENFQPTLSKNGAMRMAAGAKIGVDVYNKAQVSRDTVRSHLTHLLEPGTVLALPAAPGVAPLQNSGPDESWRIVEKNGRINSASPLAGVPQISLPLCKVNNLPLGLGLMAEAGGDEMLLDLAVKLAGTRANA